MRTAILTDIHANLEALTACIAAAEEQKVDRFVCLGDTVGYGADPNAALPEGETALMTAARSGNVDAANALLAHGADINRKETWRGQTALMWAAAEGHPDVIRALLAHGADMHARSNGGFTPLLFAVREGKIGAVKTFLEAGADLNSAFARF